MTKEKAEIMASAAYVALFREHPRVNARAAQKCDRKDGDNWVVLIDEPMEGE
jgi:hypothetical protein